METTNLTTRADFEAAETRTKVSGYIGMAYVIGGLTRANDEDFDILLDLVMEELDHSYGYLALAEIKTAILEGAKGRYGDYFGINLKSIIAWLDAYAESDTHKSVVAARNLAMQQEATRALPPRNEDRELRDSVNEAYARYLRDDRPQAPAEGTVGDILRKQMKGYDLSSPLLDIGRPKERYCNSHGIKGTLAEIFARFKAEGKTRIFQ